MYGSVKITRELRHHKQVVNRKTVENLMARMGSRSNVHKKLRVQMTDSDHAHPVAPNALDRRFGDANAPDRTWGADITFIPTDEGFLYLTGVMDL